METLPIFTQFLHDATLLHLCFVVVGFLPTFDVMLLPLPVQVIRIVKS